MKEHDDAARILRIEQVPFVLSGEYSWAAWIVCLPKQLRMRRFSVHALTNRSPGETLRAAVEVHPYLEQYGALLGALRAPLMALCCT